jgi:hypothetical protein
VEVAGVPEASWGSVIADLLEDAPSISEKKAKVKCVKFPLDIPLVL